MLVTGAGGEFFQGEAALRTGFGTFLPIHPQTRLDPSDGGEGTPTAGTAHHRLRSRVAAAMTCRRVVRSGDEHAPAEGLRFVSEMSQIGIGEMGRQTSRPTMTY